MNNKPTAIIGASNNPDRYAYKATSLLHAHQHDVYPLGIKKGMIETISIINDRPSLINIDTFTLYLNADLQRDWYHYILTHKPKRIIFNPGTENPELITLASAHGIECIEACTLVMLNTGQY